MTPESKSIGDAIRLNIGPRLRRAGYRKDSFRFYRESEDIISLVDVQTSRFDQDSFTFNLSVFDAEAWRRVWCKTVPRHPGPEDCFPCLRIGQLLTSGPRDALDKWWQANDVAQIHDSATALEMTGLPFLAGFKNRRDVALWTRMDVQGAPGMLLLAAATCALAGESQKSNFILAKLETSPVPAWRPRIQNVRGLISP